MRELGFCNLALAPYAGCGLLSMADVHQSEAEPAVGKISMVEFGGVPGGGRNGPHWAGLQGRQPPGAGAGPAQGLAARRVAARQLLP